MTSESHSQTTGGRRPRDMVLSLLVLLVPIALVVLFFQWLGEDTEVNVVDPGPPIAAAERAGLPVARPQGLPDGWRPTSAVVRTEGDSVTLRIGYVKPSGGFAQLVVSDIDAEPLLRRELGGGDQPTGPERPTGIGRPIGTEQITGEAWQIYPGRGSETALVLLEPERTVLVLGTAPRGELRTLAAAAR